MKFLQILVLIIGSVGFISAQTNGKAVLSGTVYDANGAVIPDAVVSVTNEKGENFATLANGEGIYVLNLPFNLYDTKKTDFRLMKYEIIVRKEHFEKFVLKGFKFVPSTKGKMNLDIALDLDNSNCGAGGCL